MMNLEWRELTAADVPLEYKSLLAEASEAVLHRALSLTLAKKQWRHQGVLVFKFVLCDPNLTYAEDQFQILAFIETHFPFLTAGLKPVTVQPISSSNQYETVIEEQVQGILYDYVCPCLRRFVTQMLQADKHLIGSTDVAWLVEKLSYCVIDADIKMVLEPLCPDRKVNNLTPVPASDLAQLLWIKSPVEHPQKWSKLICRTTSPLFVTS